MFKISIFGNNLGMKKLFAVIVVFAVLMFAYSGNKSFSLKNYFCGEYFCYSNAPISSASINLGSCYMDSVKSNEAIGESMKIYNFEPAAAIKKLSAKVVKTEQVGAATIIYAYSSKIPAGVSFNDSKVNLQIACYDDYSIVGWPLILGSY